MTQNMHILLVEDDPNTHDLFSMVCDHFDIGLEIAGDENSTLAALERQWPDVIVMDIFLPGIDGYTLLTTIREAQPGLQCPVVATTAYYTSDTESDLLNAGFAGYLFKPLDPQQIFPYLQGVIAAR